MKFPQIVAAQRLQTWLLVTALVAVFVAGLLVVDLARNLRTVVIGDTSKALQNALKELSQSGGAWQGSVRGTLDEKTVESQLGRASYEVLRSYPDVEGGFVREGEVVGHTFPTYTEPGSSLKQAPREAREVQEGLDESRQTGTPTMRIVHDGRDLVVIATLAGKDGQLSVWCLRRLFNFSESNELNQRILLVGAMLVALGAILVVLKLSFSLQQGFAVIQSGLLRLRTDPGYRLPDQSHELRTIALAINEMAESRQAAEADLRREDRLRMMGRVVAGIAHEIRNPLNSIRLTVRVLARRLQADSTAAEPLSLITGEIDRLDALLKSLLVFRTESTEKSRRQPLEPIIERTIALVKHHAEDHGVRIEVSAPQEAMAWVDGDYLQQALMNLLLNAIDAAGERGTVRLSVLEERDRLRVDIEDTGPGLTAEQQDRLFEAFYTTKAGGTGLGLAVTKTLLERMGASIRSVNGAQGARFEVSLPLEQMV